MSLTHPPLSRLRPLATDGTGASTRVRRHVARCARCRAALDWTRRVADDVATATSREAPPTAWAAIERRVRGGETVLLPAGTDEGGAPEVDGRRSWSRGLGRAAVLVLAVAGTAAAVVPGSPVRRWVAALTADGPAAGHEIGAPVDLVEEAAGAATFVVAAEDGAIRVLLERPDPALRIRIRVGPPGEAEVTATGAAAGARFARARGRLTVSGAGPGELLVVLPQGAETASVEVDGRPLVRKEGGRLVVLAPVSDTVGSELLITVGDAAGQEARP